MIKILLIFALAKKMNIEAANFHKNKMKLFLVTCPDQGILDSGKYSFTNNENTKLNRIQMNKEKTEMTKNVR
jgi:hypothetical protein